MSDEYDQDAGPNPADIAGATPEPESTEQPVYAAGIGPGNPEYLTPRAERAIRDADVVVGFETVVRFVREKTEGDVLMCTYENESATLEAFAERVRSGANGTAVLMGDPNHSGYQFVGKVQAAVDRPVRILPGISSLQVAASRARTPMEQTSFVTLHKSGDIKLDLRRLREDAGERHLIVLPRPYDWMPGDIATDLLEAGASDSLDALVFERLTHDDETITQTTLGKLSSINTDETPFSDLSVLVVRAE